MIYASVDFFSITGRPRYYETVKSSYDVICVTLHVRDIREEEFPFKFEMVLTHVPDSTSESAPDPRHPPLQYHLTTEIRSRTVSNNEDITVLGEMRWVRLPPPALYFNFHGNLTVMCSLISDAENNEQEHEELRIYHSNFYPWLGHGKNFTSAKVGSIQSYWSSSVHSDMDDSYAEESANKALNKDRVVLKKKSVLYALNRTVTTNATMVESAGAYTCAMLRQHDRAYISTWVNQIHQQFRAELELYPCELESVRSKNWDPHMHYTIRLTRGVETCIRCRAFGYRPPLTMFKRAETGTYNPIGYIEGRLDVDYHVNVAEGGLSEVTLTFLNPSISDSGLYNCSIHSGVRNHADLYLSFEISVL